MVFPNPVSEMVSLKFVPLENQGDLVLRIFDETGRIMAEEDFSFSEADHYTLNVSGLKPGIYRIVINTTAGKPAARATFV